MIDDVSFGDLLDMDAAAYDIGDYDNSFLHAWRATFPGGCIGYFANDCKLAGAVGIWPLDQSNAKQIREHGFSDEAKLLLHDPMKSGSAQHWYLGGVFLADEHRGGGIQLMQKCFESWMAESSRYVCDRFEIIAAATSGLANEFLAWAGFDVIGKQFDGKHPIYRKEFPTRLSFKRWMELRFTFSIRDEHD